jgi:MFS family permease
MSEPSASRGSLLVVFLTVFVDLLGFGIVMPLLPLYGQAFGLDGVWLGMLMASFSLMQFLFAPVWGRLSDRIGRRPVLIVGLLGSTVFYFLFGMASLWKSVPWLFITLIGAGIAVATIPTAQAYIADCTTKESRAKGMALIGAAFGLGFTFGPILAWAALWSSASEMAEAADQVAASPWPGFVAAITSGIALLLAIIILPESLRPGSADAVAHRKLFDWEAWQSAIATPSITSLLLTMFVSVFAFGGFEATLSLFLKSEQLPFQLAWHHVPLFFAYIGVVLMVVQGGLVRRLSTRFPELTLAMVGCGVSILGFGLLVAATFHGEMWSLMLATAVEVAGFAFINPTINSLISRRSDPEKQGSILGLSQSVSAMARIVGPPIAMGLFEITPMAPYALAVVGMMVVMVMLTTAGSKGVDFPAS